MARFHWNKNRSGKKYIVVPLVIGYVCFFTTALLASPTTAKFTDSQTVTGELTVSKQFDEYKNETNSEETVKNTENTQKEYAKPIDQSKQKASTEESSVETNNTQSNEKKTQSNPTKEKNQREDDSFNKESGKKNKQESKDAAPKEHTNNTTE